MDTNTVEVVNNVVNKVSNGLAIMAQKLDITIDKVYPIFV